jgi:hypothetical protein
MPHTLQHHWFRSFHCQGAIYGSHTISILGGPIASVGTTKTIGTLRQAAPFVSPKSAARHTQGTSVGSNRPFLVDPRNSFKGWSWSIGVRAQRDEGMQVVCTMVGFSTIVLRAEIDPTDPPPPPDGQLRLLFYPKVALWGATESVPLARPRDSRGRATIPPPPRLHLDWTGNPSIDPQRNTHSLESSKCPNHWPANVGR